MLVFWVAVVSIPYETATSGDKALVEVQRILAKFGCESFGTMIDAEAGKTMVQFRYRGQAVSLEASWKGYAAAWLKAHPYSSYSRGTRTDHERKALEQAKVSVCSILRDWVKGQTMAIECGVLSFAAAFMPHMMLPSGRRVIDELEAGNILPGAPPVALLAERREIQ